VTSLDRARVGLEGMAHLARALHRDLRREWLCRHEVAGHGDEASCARTLRHDGIAIVPDFLPAELCQALAKEALATVAAWRRGVPAVGPRVAEREDGVIDVAGLPTVDDDLATRARDGWLARVTSRAMGRPMSLVRRKCYVNESTLAPFGFHVDQVSLIEAKALVLLTWVRSRDDGAHAYVPGSHRPYLPKYTALLGNSLAGREDPFDCSRVQHGPYREIVGEPGTLILIDTAGVHCCMPQRPGHLRVVLVLELEASEEPPAPIPGYAWRP
jgi:hypothetical protein